LSKSNKQLWTAYRRPHLFTGPPLIADEQIAEVLNRHIRPLKKKLIIEYGCGDACWIEYLAEKHALKQFIGYEWNETLINIARKRCERLSNVSFVKADISEKWHKGCDLFFTLGVLEHFQEHIQVLKNLVEGLNSGGVCILIVPNLAAKDHMRKRFGLKNEDLLKERVITKSYGYEELWSPPYFISVLERAGLHVLEHWVIDRWHEREQVAVALK